MHVGHACSLSKLTFELAGAAGSEGTCKRTRARRVGSVVSGIRMDRRRGAHEACDGSHSYDKRRPHRSENESQRCPVKMFEGGLKVAIKVAKFFLVKPMISFLLRRCG